MDLACWWLPPPAREVFLPEPSGKRMEKILALFVEKKKICEVSPPVLLGI